MTDSNPRPAVSTAEAFLQQLRDEALVTEAYALAHGVRHLSIVHGQPENDDEMSRLESVANRAWAFTGETRTTSVRGGNDYLTITVEGDAAAAAVDELQTFAETMNPGWWRITQSAQPF